ncbi:FadR/GntR family transcriptional regulator [Corynebacterium auris]|uniref:FadR/GntR family transcriptional regulator n=1 Tax=Corynebacterium auris TaxID=44750 RepID=UPI0025B39204|nr:FCD domain-containing protein [Corynebacterium auris]WJY68681.1 Pyruvate dehydrogenase complex repressor [Corynebacterium auris]
MTVSRVSRGGVTPLLTTVLDQLGQEIVSGLIAEDETFTLQDLSNRFNISRTVAREVMRALEQLGLVTSSRRVGIRVLPESEWAVFDQAVIKWRWSASNQRSRQLYELNQLRYAVEPLAAGIATRNATVEQARELTDLAMKMEDLAARSDADSDLVRAAYLELDKRYHTLVLEASGNRMFAALACSVLVQLEARTIYGDLPVIPSATSRQAHTEVAHAIAAGDREAAENASRRIMHEFWDTIFGGKPAGRR